LNRTHLRTLLQQLATGRVDVDAAMHRLATLPYEDLGELRLDHHRALRCGFAEVIYGRGKTVRQVTDAFLRLANGQHNVLATRVGPKAAAAVRQRLPLADYHRLSRTLVLRQHAAEAESAGVVAVVAAGTADLSVAEEARRTLEIMDQRVRTFYDVGVAGLHRLLVHVRELRAASVLVVVAGMEGALPSVVGGLVDRPVIAVPTSVGYGASFGGVAALLAMLNSCAAGVTVVNIDNGFGAAYHAALINRLLTRSTSSPDAAAAVSASKP
jgi:hypothetical protein